MGFWLVGLPQPNQESLPAMREALILARHRGNLQRLSAGTENKLGGGKQA